MDGTVVIGTELNTKSFDAQIKQLESKLQTLEKSADESNVPEKFRRSAEEARNLNAEIEKTRNQLKDLYEKQKKLNATGFENIKKSIDGVGNSVGKVIKKVTRWGLAIFGIRSAYLAVRSAMSTLSQYDEQMATNVEYIRYLLATTLKPIIETIIQLAYKLLVYINYIAQAWFGVNLFANASTEAFQKMNSTAKATTKATKELQKTLTGFDEMNVLQDNGDVSAGGGGGGISLPKLEDVPIPSWIQWIADHGAELTAIIAGITGAVIALKLGFEGIQALGIGAIIAGILLLIQDIIKFIDDPSWEGFVNILGDIAIVIGGIMLVMNNWWGLLVIIVGAVVKLVAENWNAIMDVLGKVGGWIYNNVIKPVMDLFGGLWNGIKSGASNVWNAIVGIFSGIANWFYQNVIKPITDFFSGLWEGIKSGAQGVFNTIKSIFDTLVSVITAPLNLIIDGINLLIDGMNVVNPFGNIPRIPRIGSQPRYGGGGFRAKGGIFYPSKLPKLAVGGIINNPGAGIPYHGATIGERGAEAVVPLTDSQQMALLGEAIGKYVKIDNVIDINMDSRKINRILQSSIDRTNFAMNR